MIKIEYCGYHTHNPDRELIYRPSGTASYLFLLVLSRMSFHFPDHTAAQALPGACILYEPGTYQHYQAEEPPACLWRTAHRFICASASHPNRP